MPDLSMSDRSMIAPGLRRLRERNRALLHRYPAADPSRSLLSGFPATGEAVEAGGHLTVPSVLLEALPTLASQYMGANRAKVWDTPNTRALRFMNAADKSSIPTIKLAAALYRALVGIEGVTLETDHGITLPSAEPALFAPDQCWHSRACASGGHTSPTMRLNGKLMTVSNTLLSLAYPALLHLDWKLRRRCKSPSCVNPWHALPSEFPLATHRALQTALLVPLRVLSARLPLPRLSPMDGLVDWTASWPEWLADCERLLHETNQGQEACGTLEPEKLTPAAVMALFE